MICEAHASAILTACLSNYITIKTKQKMKRKRKKKKDKGKFKKNIILKNKIYLTLKMNISFKG